MSAKIATSSETIKIIAMKSIIIAGLVSSVLVTSCSVYRSGQTPDDVYYSPSRQSSAAYVQTANRDDSRYNAYDEGSYYDNNYLRMRVHNRSRWSAFDNYGYNDFGYSPMIGSGFNMGYGYANPFSYSYNNYFNSYMNWNSFYNPYYPSYIIVSPSKNPIGYNKVRNFNMSNYTNTRYNNNNNLGRARPAFRGPVNKSNTTSNSSGLGTSFRRAFSNSNSNVNSGRTRDTYSVPQQRPVREYNPSYNNNNNSNNNVRSNSSSGSSNSGSSNSGSSGGGAGGRPSRR